MSTSPPDNTKLNNICQVCGDSASINNYGALTCSSCRTFFRRNGFYTKVSVQKQMNYFAFQLFRKFHHVDLKVIVK